MLVDSVKPSEKENSLSVRKSLLAERVDISIKIVGATIYDVSIPYGTT